MAGAARWIPGVLVAGLAAAAAAGTHVLLPLLPLLTIAVIFGVGAGAIPVVRSRLDGSLKPGLALSSRRLLRIGIVLLGLKLSLVDIANLGPVTIAVIAVVVASTFAVTYGLGRLARLPGRQPILLAAGFSICGVSAIGAVAAVTDANDEDIGPPVALVTLFGTLAIVLLPASAALIGLTATEFGMWAGLSVHDVGQVVATAQIAGQTALAVAVVVKLTRVLALAPITAGIALVERRTAPGVAPGPRPSIVPLFVAGFFAAILLRTFVPIPDAVLEAVDVVQIALLAMALFSLGASIRFSVFTAGGAGLRAAAVGLASWVFIAVGSLLAVVLIG